MKTLAFGLMLPLILSGCAAQTHSHHEAMPIRAENPAPAMAQFFVTPYDVSSASVQTLTVVRTGRKLAELDVLFSSDKAAEYHQFTEQHLNQRIQVLVGTNVIVQPWIFSADTSGKLEVSISDFERAQRLADLLARK
jgi:hypothetical protein